MHCVIKISFNIIIKHLHVYNVLLWSFQRLVLGLTKITIFTDEKDRLNDMILSSQGTISWLSWYSTSNRNTPELSGTIVDVISSPDTMNLQHSCVLYHYWYAHILCGAGSMHLSGVRPSVLPSVHQSVCLSQYGPTAANPMVHVCCCGPGRHEISIDCCTTHSNATYGERMRVVPRCQRT